MTAPTHVTPLFYPSKMYDLIMTGKVKGMSSVGSGDDDDDRKKWAWG